MSLTASELSFLRLLDRTKRLAREDLAANVWKVNAAVLYLENLFNRLEDEKKLHSPDTLLQYWRELNEVKLLVEAEFCKYPEEKLSHLDRIPRRFPDVNGILSQDQKKVSRTLKEIASEVRARNRVVYRADLRKVLLGLERQRRDDEPIPPEEQQENIAKELLSLTRSLKEKMMVAGSVLKDDNKRLLSMHARVDTNTERLRTEGARLNHHAFKCGFDCILVFVAIFIFWTFICMVIFMKIFPKKPTS